MSEGSSVETHVLRMMSDIDKLEHYGVKIPQEFGIDVVLSSLSSSFKGFVKKFLETSRRCQSLSCLIG